jgi:hypothetical protein
MKVERYRLARAIAVGLAAAALGTPGALADPWGSDAQQQQSGAPALLSEHGLGQNTTSAASEPKNNQALVAATSVALVAGEAKNVAPFVAGSQGRGRHGEPLALGMPQSQPVQRPGGFDWGDAGIGGAATLALVLLVAGSALVRHGGRRQEAHG